MPSFNIVTVVVLFTLLFGVFFQSASAHLHELPRFDADEDTYATVTATTTSAPPATSTLAKRPQANAFNFNLTFSLPRASNYLTTLDALPAVCQSYNTPSSECKGTMTAANVTFDDCGDSWTICRCDDAQMTMDVAVDRFARVPTGLRRYVGTVMVMGDKTPHAYTLTTGDIHLFNDCQMETWLHESTHAFDFATGQGISRQDGWNQAIKADSCVPDNYAQTNPTEDFAQMGVIKIYELARGELPPGFDPDCMANQLEFMDNLPLYDEDTLFGNTCDIPDVKGPTGAKKLKAPANLNTTKVFPVDDAPPVDFPIVSASVEAKEKATATATPGPGPSGAPVVGNVGSNPAAGSDPDDPEPSGPSRVIKDNSAFVRGPSVAGLYSAGVTILGIAVVAVLI